MRKKMGLNRNSDQESIYLWGGGITRQEKSMPDLDSWGG
jgi:hypothetical protein